MEFSDVLRWVMGAKLEEQLALHAVLQCNVIEPAHAARHGIVAGRQYTIDRKGVPVKIGVPGLGMADAIAEAELGTAPPEAGRPLPPGRYKLRGLGLTPGKFPGPRNGVKLKPPRTRSVSVKKVAKALGAEPLPPGKLYKPQSAFAKKWWERLNLSRVALSADMLAHVAGKRDRAKEVSTQLGTLYKRGIVDRHRVKGNPTYFYKVKGAL